MGCDFRECNLSTLFGGLFSHHVKFYSFMFMRKISTQVVCVKGNELYGII